MNKMKTLIIFGIFFLLCFLFSCTETQNSKSQIIYIDPQKLSTKSFSDFYRIKTVIPLETNNYSMIKEIDNIIFSEDNIIIGGLTAPAFMIYDCNGTFVKKIDKRGNGPDEYGREIGTFVIDQTDPSNNLIMNKSPRLLFYNYHSWKQVKVAKWIGASTILGSLPNGDFLAYQEFGSDNDYFIKLLNQEGETLKGFLPKPSQVFFTIPFRYSTSFTYHHNNRVYVLPFFTHSIYEYDYTDTLLYEKYRFDIKNNPPIQLSSLSQQDIENFSYINDFYKLHIKHIGNSNMIISASINNISKLPITCIINLKTFNAEVFSSKSLRDEQEEIPISFIWTNLSQPVAIVSPEELIGFTTTRPDSWGTKLKKEIQEDSNPILVIYEER